MTIVMANARALFINGLFSISTAHVHFNAEDSIFMWRYLLIEAKFTSVVYSAHVAVAEINDADSCSI